MRPAPVNPTLQSGPAHPFAVLERMKEQRRADGLPLFDFTIGDPLEPTPDFVRDTLVTAIPRVSQYPSVAGTAALRQAIAAYLQRRFDVVCDPRTQVLPCAGAKEAIFHLPLAVIDPSSPRRRVLYGEPGYPVYERGAALAGGIPHPVPLLPSGGFGLDLLSVPAPVLEQTALVWINTPHNPTGATASLDHLVRQVACAAEHGFWIASDETYADLWFDSPPPSILQAAQRVGYDRVVAIHSLSKRSGMTGYRSGFHAGSAHLLDLLRKLRPSCGVASPSFVQAAAAAAWSDDAHAEQRRQVFLHKFVRVLDTARRLGLSPLDGAAGLYVWAALPPGADDGRYAQELLRSGVAVTPGRAFGPQGAGHIRLALVPLAAELDAALEAWADAHPLALAAALAERRSDGRRSDLAPAQGSC